MNYEESLRVVRALSEGVDPENMVPIPADSPLQRPSYIRAFYSASRALEQIAVLERRRSRQPANTGKTWSDDEDAKLVRSFDEGTSLKLLAADHQRSQIAIRARLIKLGKISESDTLM